MHICIECGDSVEAHDEMCRVGCRHFPALCCPGCPCLSFYEAHPIEVAEEPQP